MKNNDSILNKKLDLRLVGVDGEVNLNQFEGIKVISYFPKLNTKVCDLQTMKTIELAKKYKDVKFISITLDKVDVIEKWCQKNEAENALIFSDNKYKDFAHKTGFYKKKLNILERGLILLNHDNDVIFVGASEMRKVPNFDALEIMLNQIA